MPLLLHIDTATEHASVCLTKNELVIGFAEHADQKNHGAFLQPAIQKLFQDAGYVLKNVDAISVSNGPGSYTGLRVGLASAKGLCYALNKPLILVNTLQVIAVAAIKKMDNTWQMQDDQTLLPATYFCPLIDARRMEVFTAVYNSQLQIIVPPTAIIVDENSFAEQLTNHKIIFSGSGHQKLKALLQHQHATFSSVQHNAMHLGILAEQKFSKNDFSDLAYSEPFYLKEFYSPIKP